MNSRLCWTFAITSLALFAFTLDRLVVAIALPAIRTDLGAEVAGLEWTVNAYTLSFAVLLLTGGALGDRFGRRRPLLICCLALESAALGWLAAVVTPDVPYGLLAAVSLPRGAGRRRTRALTDPLARCDNDARDAVSAGAAG
jgi:MFS family permease